MWHLIKKEKSQKKTLTGANQGAVEALKLGHIEDRQLIIMLTFVVATKIFLMFPSLITQKTGSAAWLATIISTIVALIGLKGWFLWIKTTGNLGFVESVRLTLGRVLGDASVILLLSHFIVTAALSIRIFAGGSVIGLLPEFPIEILLYVVIGVAAYSAWLGLENPARASLFFFWPVSLAFFLVIIGAYRLFDVRHIYPIFGLGLKTVIKQGAIHAGLFGSMSLLAVLKSYVREPDEVTRSGKQGILLASLFMTLSTFITVTVFPYPESARQVMPVGVIARAVYFGRFFQRLESLFTFSWFFASAVHASVSLIMVLILLAQLLNVKTYRPLIPAIAVLVFGIGAIPGSLLQSSKVLSSIYLTLGNLEVVSGWILFAVARVRGVEEKAECLAKELVAKEKSPSYSEDPPEIPASGGDKGKPVTADEDKKKNKVNKQDGK